MLHKITETNITIHGVRLPVKKIAIMEFKETKIEVIIL
jgi:hypothetical protein